VYPHFFVKTKKNCNTNFFLLLFAEYLFSKICDCSENYLDVHPVFGGVLLIVGIVMYLVRKKNAKKEEKKGIDMKSTTHNSITPTTFEQNRL
jgi:hypothetical protein